MQIMRHTLKILTAKKSSLANPNSVLGHFSGFEMQPSQCNSTLIWFRAIYLLWNTSFAERKNGSFWYYETENKQLSTLMRTVFRGSHIKINNIFGISMIKSTGKDAKTKTFQTFVGIGPPY